MAFCSATCDLQLVRFIFMDAADFYSLSLIWKHSQTDLNFILMCSLFVAIKLMGKAQDLLLKYLLCHLWSLVSCSVQAV